MVRYFFITKSIPCLNLDNFRLLLGVEVKNLGKVNRLVS